MSKLDISMTDSAEEAKFALKSVLNVLYVISRKFNFNLFLSLVAASIFKYTVGYSYSHRVKVKLLFINATSICLTQFKAFKQVNMMSEIYMFPSIAHTEPGFFS